ncbi:MAG: hypothetical protein HKN95_00390 [Acidimicrobiia bacterium]|nr:hypothetical protein [Acidimicrobiia bacterium]NNL69315.1 hypothetical protein [Acidimicrobiia bacterium]
MTATGLNVAGAVEIAQELGLGHTVVTVAVDTGLKYLAGDLYGRYRHAGKMGKHDPATRGATMAA